MSPPWSPQLAPETAPLGVTGVLRALLKAGALLVLLASGLVLLLALRLAERALARGRRRWSPWVTVAVCRLALRLIGLRVLRRGDVMTQPGGIVANHGSWLDIFVLNALGPVCFVAKSEVARWPVVGWLARATGTVFIRRERRDARVQRALLLARLKAGQRLLFFPEGTSADGLSVLPFKSTLFAAFFMPETGPDTWVQPISLRYRAPAGRDPRFYGWWGEMSFFPHLLKVLGAPRQGGVFLCCQAPLRVADFSDRKALAEACESAVRAGMRLGAEAPRAAETR